MHSITEVRALQQRWDNLMEASVCGSGFAQKDGSWIFKVNTRLTPNGDVPTEIDGIPIIVEVTESEDPGAPA